MSTLRVGLSGADSPVDALVDGTAGNSGKLAGGGTGVNRGGGGGGKEPGGGGRGTSGKRGTGAGGRGGGGGGGSAGLDWAAGGAGTCPLLSVSFLCWNTNGS